MLGGILFSLASLFSSEAFVVRQAFAPLAPRKVARKSPVY